jgi:hypothetical protein
MFPGHESWLPFSQPNVKALIEFAITDIEAGFLLLYSPNALAPLFNVD